MITRMGILHPTADHCRGDCAGREGRASIERRPAATHATCLCGHWHDERRNRLRSNQRGALETATSQPEAVRHRHDLPNEAELCKVLSFRSAEPARITQAESERVINTKDRIDTVRDAVRNILI
jgi:hypothetical protein